MTIKAIYISWCNFNCHYHSFSVIEIVIVIIIIVFIILIGVALIQENASVRLDSKAWTVRFPVRGRGKKKLCSKCVWKLIDTRSR